MDSIVFEETITNSFQDDLAIDKQYLYVNDQNNGSYSSQIQLDSTPLSNSGAFLNWQEGFILVPLMLQIESTATTLTATSASDYIACLKSGYWNILHSMTVEFNSNNVVSQVPFLNVFCNFKNLTSWSNDDLKNWGSVCGFFPDSSRSWAYNEGDSAAVVDDNLLNASGSGLSNNRNAPYVSISAAFNAVISGADFASAVCTVRNIILNSSTVATQLSSDLRQAWNSGMLERHKFINYNPILSGDPANPTSPYSSNKGYLMSSANSSQVFQTYSGAVANARYYAIDAVIRLKDVCNFFEKVPLLKGAQIKIFLNTNQVYFQVTQTSGVYDTDAADFGTVIKQPNLFLSQSPVMLGGGQTNPVQYASNGIGQGASVLTPFIGGANTAAATSAVVNVSLSIVRTQFSQMTNSYSCPITSCRLYCPAYKLSEVSQQKLYALMPIKKVVYNDIFQFSFPNQATNSPFNILVSNGITNIKSILVMCLLPSASNGTVPTGGVRSSSILSPFSSTPSSPDPLIIQNFQVQLSGKNLFNNQLQYDYEDFVEQLVSSNQLNGNLTTSMSSGLISKNDFQNLYRYYYANCSRCLKDVSIGVQIQGTILSPNVTSVDLMVFCEYEKSISVDLRVGQLADKVMV